MNELPNDGTDDAERLDDFGEHLICTVELLSGLQERFFEGFLPTESYGKTGFEKLDELLTLSLADFDKKYDEVQDRKNKSTQARWR
jgi:hypothetical protein